MESKDVKSDFTGLGPLPTTKTTYSQGIGMGGSFAPITTHSTGSLQSVKQQNKIQVYSSGPTDGQMFRVEVDHNTETALVYLGNTELTEYLQLQTDTDVGQSSIYGYAGNGAQNFQLSANDTDEATKLVLFDSGSANYLESKIDTDSGKTSVYGYTDNASNYFLLQAKDEDTKLYLEGGGDNSTLHPYALVINNSAGSTGIYEPHQLTISIASGDQSYLSTSALFIETSIGDGTYEPHQLTLRDSNGGVDANTAEIKTYTSSGSYAAIGSDGTLNLENDGGKIFLLTDGSNAYGRFESGDYLTIVNTGHIFVDYDNGSVRAAVNNNGGTADLTLSEGASFASLFSDGTLSMKDSAGTTIDMACSALGGHNATWKEIDICVGGVAKKMLVLGTDPY